MRLLSANLKNRIFIRTFNVFHFVNFSFPFFILEIDHVYILSCVVTCFLTFTPVFGARFSRSFADDRKKADHDLKKMQSVHTKFENFNAATSPCYKL